jgi:hypothetical protein
MCVPRGMTSCDTVWTACLGGLSTHVMPSVQDTDSHGSSMQAPEDAAMSWLVDEEEDEEDTASSGEASSSQPQIPLWQRVGRFFTSSARQARSEHS